MELRPRLARWQHSTWRGRSSSAATSSTTSSALGVNAGPPAAGAAVPHAPGSVFYGEGDTTCTSSSSHGGIRPPASNGTSPMLASPSAAGCWPQVRIDDFVSECPRVYTNSSGAPARYGQAPSPNGVPCAHQIGFGRPASCWRARAHLSSYSGWLGQVYRELLHPVGGSS